MASEKLRKKLQKRQEDLKKRGSGSKLKYFTLKEGITRMRLLFVGEENEPGIEVKHTYFNQNLGGMILPSTFGLKDYIHRTYEKLKNSKNVDDRELAEKFPPRTKFLVLAYRYKDEKGLEVDVESGMKPLLIGPRLYQQIIELFLDDENGDMTDPIKGYDIKFKRSGKGQFDTEYSALPCKPSKCAKAFRGPFDIEEETKKILPSYEETKDLMNQFLEGASNGDEDEDDEDDFRKKSKKKHKKAKSDI